MKNLTAAIAISLASLSASAYGDAWTITIDNGESIRVMPTTARLYKNEHDTIQADALVELAKRGEVTRVRWGVTGCGVGHGSAAIVTQAGAPRAGAKMYDWALEGDRAYDGLSALVCRAARERRSGKSGVSV